MFGWKKDLKKISGAYLGVFFHGKVTRWVQPQGFSCVFSVEERENQLVIELHMTYTVCRPHLHFHFFFSSSYFRNCWDSQSYSVFESDFQLAGAKSHKHKLCQWSVPNLLAQGTGHPCLVNSSMWLYKIASI